jgi:hypothetical protein
MRTEIRKNAYHKQVFNFLADSKSLKIYYNKRHEYPLEFIVPYHIQIARNYVYLIYVINFLLKVIVN